MRAPGATTDLPHRLQAAQGRLQKRFLHRERTKLHAIYTHQRVDKHGAIWPAPKEQEKKLAVGKV